MITETNITNLLQGLATVNAAAITDLLTDARLYVLNDGVPETNPMFDLLHKHYTMHLLQLWGHVEDIELQEVGDIKTAYKKTSLNVGETKWLAEYKRELILAKGIV